MFYRCVPGVWGSPLCPRYGSAPRLPAAGPQHHTTADPVPPGGWWHGHTAGTHAHLPRPVSTTQNSHTQGQAHYLTFDKTHSMSGSLYNSWQNSHTHGQVLYLTLNKTWLLKIRPDIYLVTKLTYSMSTLISSLYLIKKIIIFKVSLDIYLITIFTYSRSTTISTS